MRHTKVRGRAEIHTAAFPIVAIGASAGGLDAFSRLLKQLPSDTGMGFVLVQHLDPIHESALSQILARATTMPVREVRNNTKVTPNCVFVIPPNVVMTISQGVLKLHPRSAAPGSARSIDAFFESLAAERQERAIAVVLSGTASDGSIGMEAIKAEGGITFAQDESAMYDSMPRSAVATGCVDFILNPESIAAELGRIARHPFIAGRPAESVEDAAPSPKRGVQTSTKGQKPLQAGRKDSGYNRILFQLRNHSGVDFSLYKPSTINRRIQRRIVLKQLENVDAYAESLRGNAKELNALYADLLIHVTSFFRNPEAFKELKRKVFPKLLAEKRTDPIRVWVAGCSTGQEAYSIAMALMEAAEDLAHAPRIQIFATDLNEALLEKARNGVYPMSIEHEVSPERLRHFFTEESGSYRVCKQVREMVVFARQNLISDPPFSRIDLISCRNVMIYLEAPSQEKIIQTLQYALVPNGFLFLGASESIGSPSELLEVVDKKHKIFSKSGSNPSIIRRHVATPPAASRQYAPAPRAAKRPKAQPVELNAEREADRVTIGTYAPPAVLINSQLQVIQFRGLTGDYLEPSPGKASFNILKMAREGLATPLRVAIEKAKNDGQNVRKANIDVSIKGAARKVDLEVIPLKNLKDPCYLIFFEPVLSEVASRRAKLKHGKFRRPDDVPAGGLPTRRVSQLVRELAEVHDYLKAVQEQNEAANEELQASNEEVTSANEELQSMNEELETSKEELESANEELMTVNEEMNHRNSELTRLNNDLNNFYASVSMPIVKLDRSLRVKHYTAPAEKLLNFIATDIDRPISAIRNNLDLPDLEKIVKEAIDTVSLREREVRDKDGHWYSLRVRPYVTTDKKIDGAVLLLVDIDDIKRLQQSSQESLEYAQAVIQAVPPLVVLTEQLNVRTVNRSFCKKFAVAQDESENHSVFDLGGGQWNIPKLREMLHDLVGNGDDARNVEVTHEFKDLGKRTLVLSASFVQLNSRHKILLCIDDITERKRAEETLIAANRSKDEFLATLAHELRNPLAPIRNSLQIMEHAKGEPSMVADARCRMQRQMGKLVQLVDDLMDVSRINRGKVVLRKRHIELATVIDDVIETCRAMPECAKREITVKLPKDPIHMDADPLRLSQIIGNLVGNGCKYTNPDGKVSIFVERDGNDAVIRVKDTGIGIARDMISGVFDIFTQVDHSLERTHGGLGLGLAIVKRMVQLHDGTVEVHSPGLNKGSEFTVRIPIVESAKPESSARLTAVALPDPAKFVKRKILIADDNTDSAETLALLLQLDGHEVRTAFDGVDALATAEQFHPDVAFLDIGMPRMNGYDAAREMRKAEWGRDLVLVALTGWGQEHDRRNAQDAGFNHHLVKPADIADLRRVISVMKGR